MSIPRMLLLPSDTATALGVTVGTLAKWRLAGGGPPYLKVGARVRYDSVDLETWLAAKRRVSTSSASVEA
jgi:hypothetical protein